ncbi:unnamed protein product [Meloidogyne enterolobii]|uniref:Uncharacterized protein n=1 Tax=Meloidogyne enterolobii TaxID=390850 RepID=A0ACB1A666_MELEN
MDLHGKAVVVIGATTGFGHQFVIKCASKGMTVFAACNSPNGVQKVVQATSHLSGFVHAHSLDLSSTDSVEKFFRQVINQLPPGTGIHALVNNAGIIRAGADDWLAMEDYEHVLRVNLLGLIQITKLFKEHIKLAKGRILFCSSICGRIAFPYYGPYTVSKFAMEGYCDTIRRELSPFGVKVAVVEPGYFRTPITNPDHIPNEMEKSFNKSSQYIKEQYGHNFILKNKEIAKNHLSSKANSPRVDWVVDVYFHACTAIFPRKRYVVGIDANYVVIPISRLPTEIQDLIFWLNSIILKNPLPKILHNGGCLNAKMVHRWIKSANGFVAYLEGEEKER